MKKSIALFTAVLAFMLIAPICACETEQPEPEKVKITYKSATTYAPDGTPISAYAVRKVEKDADVKEIVIPSEYRGFPVVEILADAFMGCQGLERVTIPEGVEYIYSGAFRECEDLIEVKLPSTVKGIWYSAFRHCKKLANITLPNSITYIGHNILTDTALYANEANWQDGVLYVGDYLLAGNDCSGDYTVKSGTKVIAEQAFQANAGLTSVTLSEGVTVCDKAFSECDNLQKVVVKGGATHLGRFVFSDCPALTEAVFEDGIAEIGRDSFAKTPYAENPDHYEGDILYVGKYAVGTKKSFANTQVIREGTVLLCDHLFVSDASYYFEGEAVIPTSLKIIGIQTFGLNGYDPETDAPKLFYRGTAADWAQVTALMPEITIEHHRVFYYSETQPEESGYFWHFVDGEPKVW